MQAQVGVSKGATLRPLDRMCVTSGQEIIRAAWRRNCLTSVKAACPAEKANPAGH